MAYNSRNMKNFNNIFDREKRNSASESDFKRRGPAKRDFGRRDGGRPQMYEATCSECGKRCELPFRPTGDKPVFCSQCFNSRGGESNRERPGSRRDGGNRRFQDKTMFDAVCDKCGRHFELPFKPTGERAVYCKECFEKGGSSDKTDYKDQLESLGAKLDTIIKLLSSSSQSKEDDLPEAETKKKAKKPKKTVEKKKKGRPKH